MIDPKKDEKRCYFCGGEKFYEDPRDNEPHIAIVCSRCKNWHMWTPKSETFAGAKDYVLKFGQYKGVPLNLAPIRYLEWCIDNLEDDKLVRKIKAVHEHRRNNFKI